MSKPAKRKADKPAPQLSAVARKVVQMLKRESGASLSQLQEALPDTKLGYLRADAQDPPRERNQGRLGAGRGTKGGRL
jgi:hypothetical protein